MNTANIQDTIIGPLEAHTGVTFVMSGQDGEIADAPHVVFTFTVPYTKGVGRPTQRIESNAEGVRRIQSEQYNVTLSITAVTDWEESERCVELAQAARDWFDFFGYDVLSAADIVAANLTDVQNRDSVNDDESRWGFDAMLRVSRELVQSTNWIERVEATQIQGG